MGNNKTWEYKEHFHAIGMTGDYGGHYEVTNGSISLCTNDDPEDISETENTLQKVARVLNESDCKFYCNTTTEHKLHIENMELRYKMDDLKDQARRMADALEMTIKHAKECEELYNISGDAVIESAEATLQQFKDGKGKEVEKEPYKRQGCETFNPDKTIICVECKTRPAVTDYNGCGHYVCKICDDILGREFEDEYQ